MAATDFCRADRRIPAPVALSGPIRRTSRFYDTAARGGIFAFMADPERFRKVQVAHAGLALLWVDDNGDDRFLRRCLRMQAEANANAVKSMAK